ncbi:MAG: carboxypeptidase regulatory-like domain-containing protein [Deltaproteobacteria bacterium]|nr:carboxypeptidase regulatory-like domain-containing protein [Deltaproteobacteria bacterium]
MGAQTCNATGDGATCTATAAAAPSTDDNNDNRFDDDCDGAIDEDFVAPTLQGGGRLHLRVIATDGGPVTGARVELTGDATADGVTDESGDFVVDTLTYGSLHVEVAADDHAPARYTLAHTPATAGSLVEYVVKPVDVFTFSSEEGGVATTEGATVTLPAGGYVSKLSGDPVVGPLEVRVAYFDGAVEEDMRASPPLYRTDEGPGATLQTFGMVDVELFIHGEPVQLGEGTQAQLDLPLADYADALAIYRTIYPESQTIPAWYWNDVEGLWSREGEGQVVEVEGELRWQAAVTHFTRWNADAVYGFWDFPCWWNGCYTCSRVPAWMRACGTDTGRCQAGQLRCWDDGGHQVHLYDGGCTNGYCNQRICDGEIGPTGETCNGQDDDCDGSTDEGYNVGASCSAGVGQCRRTGSIQCSGGSSSCNVSAGPAGTETCTPPGATPVDEDCDGAVDEGLGLGATCSEGTGACRRTGTKVCSATGTVVCNVVAGTPTAETCNDVDDDCDGAVDDGLGKGDTCTLGLGECQRSGVKVCGGDGTAVCNAQPPAPGVETCNGRDDNCNGEVDDDPRVDVSLRYTNTSGFEETSTLSGTEGTTCSFNACGGEFICTPTAGGGASGSCVGATFDSTNTADVQGCASPEG